MGDRKLIELVRDHPVIYNKFHEDYKNPVQKTEAWNEIAQELGEDDPGICYKRWSTLRERYTVDIRKQRKKDPDGSPIVFHEWTYYPLIHSFLGKYYAPRNRRSHLKKKKVTPVRLSMEDMEEVEDVEEVEEMEEMDDMTVSWNAPENVINIPKTTEPPQVAAVSAMLASLPQPYLGAAVEKVMPIILQYSRMSRLRLPIIESE